MHITISSTPVAHAGAFVRFSSARAIKSLPWLERSVRKVLNWYSGIRRRVPEGGLAGSLKSLFHLLSRLIFAKHEVIFFEWVPDSRHSRDDEPLLLEALNLDLLARAAMTYVDEPETMTYLMRAAGKLRASGNGFALTNPEGTPVHICWNADFHGFHMPELDFRLTGQSPDSTLIFDCWTPIAHRGREHCPRGIERAAEQLSAEGKKPWIFSNARNQAFIDGIESAGFQRRFGLVRQRWFMVPTPVKLLRYESCDRTRQVTSAA
jgi:hypothetical protein